jgi:ribosome-associated protein YbcJ (S4-like RNA binding protein)
MTLTQFLIINRITAAASIGRRVVVQNAVEVNGKVENDPARQLKHGDIVVYNGFTPIVFTPWSVLYVTREASLHQVGPFNEEKQALEWIAKNNGTGEDAEIDINDQHVYLLSPDHVKTEVRAFDLPSV